MTQLWQAAVIVVVLMAAAYGFAVLTGLRGRSSRPKPIGSERPALPDYPFAFMHRGHGGCGGPVALLRRRPGAGDVVASHDAIHIDGSPVEFQSEVRCDTCGKPVGGFLQQVAYIEERGTNEMVEVSE